MSQITAEAYAQKLDKIARHPAMSDDNIRLRAGAGDAPSTVLIAIGVVALAATIAGGFVYRIEHALAAFEIGAVTVTALSLGAMFWIMVSYLVNAGWMVTVRRQMEHVMMMLPLCVVLMAIVAVIEYSQGASCSAGWASTRRPATCLRRNRGSSTPTSSCSASSSMSDCG